MKSRIYRSFGFTLIEVMIVAAIIAILAAIAYPSYQDSVRKSRRADAISVLISLQLQQEKWRANHTTYTSDLTNLGGSPASDYYTFAIDVPATAPANATSYRISATAKSGKGQENDKQNGVSCTPLTINQNSTKSPAACWSK